MRSWPSNGKLGQLTNCGSWGESGTEQTLAVSLTPVVPRSGNVRVTVPGRVFHVKPCGPREPRSFHVKPRTSRVYPQGQNALSAELTM